MIAAVGLDLSTVSTGLCRPNGDTRTLRPQTRLKPAQLHELADRVTAQVKASRPQLAVIEGYALRTHPGALVALAELGGVIRVRLYELAIPYLIIPPSTLKKFATGNGKATKQEMVDAAIALGGRPANHDEADAWFLWLAAQQRYEHHSDRPPLTPTLLGFPWPELRGVAA